MVFIDLFKHSSTNIFYKSFFLIKIGEVMLYKLTNESENLYANLMNKKEHDGLVNCLATCYDSNLALSGSEDAR